MRESMLFLYQCIVGFEYGFDGEGNEQWYYFLSLVINSMLTYMIKPELWKVFTGGALIHFITICIYGYMLLDERNSWYSIVLYIIHGIILLTCYSIDWQWTYVTAAITIGAFLLAPKSMGDNIFIPIWSIDINWTDDGLYFLQGNKNTFAILFFHTIYFAAFVTITLFLPVSLLIRIIIIISCIALHPVIDISMAKGMIISEVVKNAFYKAMDHILEEK